MAAKCQGITRGGSRCKVRPLPGRPWCVHHDPDREDERAERNRRGGEAKATARRAAKRWKALSAEIDPEDLPNVLRVLIFAVENGDISPQQATAIVALAKGAISIHESLTILPLIEELKAEIAEIKSKGDEPL